MDTPRDESGWTLAAWIAHSDALRHSEERFEDERDRRYSQGIDALRELIRYKWSADEKALLLARESQNYKDEKANGLRAVIESDRGQNVTREEWGTQHSALAEKIEAQLKPLNDFMALQQGRSAGISTSTGVVLAVLGFLVALATALILYSANQHSHTPAPPASTVTVTASLR